MVKRSVIAIAVAVVALLAAACGGSTDATSTPTTLLEQTAQPATTASAAPTVPPTAAPTTVPATTSPPTTVPPAPAGPPNIDELLDQTRPLNIAHAGGDQAFPHSTPFAFAKAVELGADVLEMDVQLTGDGVLVVQHDDTVDKRYDASGRVDALTLDELRALDGAYWFAPGQWPSHDLDDAAYIYRGVRTGATPAPDGFGPDDFAVATFREIADRFPNMPFDIEMKGSFADTPDVAKVLADELRATGRLDSTVVTSFDDELIAAFSEAAPEVDTSPGLAALTNWILAGVPLDASHRIVQIPPEFQGQQVLTPEVLALADDAGVAVWIWPSDVETQENAGYYQQLLDMGIHGIIAGDPVALEAIL